MKLAKSGDGYEYLGKLKHAPLTSQANTSRACVETVLNISLEKIVKDILSGEIVLERATSFQNPLNGTNFLFNVKLNGCIHELHVSYLFGEDPKLLFQMGNNFHQVSISENPKLSDLIRNTFSN